MSWLSDSSPLVSGGWLSTEYGGHGVIGSAVPSTGTHGAALLFNDITLPGEANDEFRALILTRPSGTLTIYEDSSLTYSGSGGSGTYQGFKNGVAYGVGTYTITIGSAPPPPPAPAPSSAGMGPMLGITSTGQVIAIIPVQGI